PPATGLHSTEAVVHSPQRPRPFHRRRSRSPGRADRWRLLGRAVIQPFEVERLQDVFEPLLEARSLDRVRPHDDRVLVVVRVVTATATDDLETELFVEPDGDVVRWPHLEREPARAEMIRALDQRRHQRVTVPL